MLFPLLPKPLLLLLQDPATPARRGSSSLDGEPLAGSPSSGPVRSRAGVGQASRAGARRSVDRGLRGRCCPPRVTPWRTPGRGDGVLLVHSADAAGDAQ